MNESGLHYFNPRDEYFTFVNTVSNNKEGFTSRHIKGEEAARDLYATFIYPSTKYYKLVIRSNRIKNLPVMMQDIDVVQILWGNISLNLKAKQLGSN